MLTIRLTRKGKKNQPFFRIVVIDKRRSSKGGRAVEVLGHINPLTKKNSIEKERVLYWLKNGAKASPRVHNLLVSEKVIDSKKINVFKIRKGKPVEQKQAPLVPAELPVLASPSAPSESPLPDVQKNAENLPVADSDKTA